MVLVFLSTRDARKCMENIISHANHAGFTCDTPLNYSGNGKCMCGMFFCVWNFHVKNRVKLCITCKPKRGKRIHAHCTVYRTSDSEERKYCTATFNRKAQ